MNPIPRPEIPPALPASGSVAATWIELERRMIGLFARGVALTAILEELVRFVEVALPGHRAIIVRRTASGDELVLALSASLRAELGEAFLRVPRASAACPGEREVVEDVELDSRWEFVRAPLLHHGIHACWSQPIVDIDGAVLGAFTLYTTTRGKPGVEAIQHLELAAHLAGVALERAESDRARRLHEVIVAELADSIVLVDESLRISECNPATERMFGWSRAELIGRSPRVFYPDDPSSDALLEEAVACARRDGRWQGERPFRTKDGRLGTRATTVVTLGGALGEQYGYLAISRDITEERRTAREDRLRSLQLEYHADNALIAFILWDADGRVVRWSRHAERVFGWKAEEVLGKQLGDFQIVHPDDLARVRDLAREMLAGRTQSLVSSSRNVTKSGDVIECVWHNSLLTDETGRVVSTMSLVLDVTEQRLAEAEREELRSKMLQTQKLESLGILAGGIAHDFNNLLTGILGNAELAAESAELPARIRNALAAILLSAGRAADLTRQMLAYSGRASFERALVDLSAEVREIGVLIASSIAKKVDLRFELARDLPPIEADRAQLQQLAMNLVINAAEAIGDDTGEVVVSSWAWTNPDTARDVQYPADGLAPGRYVALEVRDTGCGMDSETQQRIFDPFFTTKFTGRGLGLAAVLGIVRAHDGGLQVVSELGRGTSFRVFLPVSTKERRGVPDLASSSPANVGTVLVIDDEPVVADVATTVLSQRGHRVYSALSGAQGLALFDAHADEISVVLLDVTMPRMGAREILDALRRRRPDVKVVLTSGYTEAEVMRQFAVGEFDGFVQKPYSSSRLLAGLRKALEQR